MELRGFENFVQFIWVFVLLLLGYIFSVVTASSLYDWYWKDSPSRSATEASVFAKEKKYALDSIGRDSVYSFILSKSRFARAFALAVISMQVWALFHFVDAARKDFTDDQSDYIYSWKCPRNSLECTDESDLDWEGWIIFSILMAAHLMKDFVNGLKLLLFCGKRSHGIYSKIRYFTGGLFLTWISSFALYASTVYNKAIARSTTDIIVNAVIIMFIMDVDEYLCKAIMSARSFWEGSGGGDDERDAVIASLSADVAGLSVRFVALERRLQNRDKESEKLLKNWDEELETRSKDQDKKLVAISQDLDRMVQSNEVMETQVKALGGMLSSQQLNISEDLDYDLR